ANFFGIPEALASWVRQMDLLTLIHCKVERSKIMNIEKMHCTAFKRYGEKRDGVFNSIQAHSIGTAQNTAKAIRDNMNQYSPGGIVHAVVDAEIEDHAIEL